MGQQVKVIEQQLSKYVPHFKLISLADVSLDPQQLSRLKRFDTVVTESGHQQSYVYSRLTQGDGVIMIGPIMGFNPLPLSSMVLMMLMGLLITALSAYLLVFSIERRVKSIQHGVNEFSKAPTQLPKLDEEADVIGRLAWSINSMSFRIYRLLSDQKQIIQAISHELRTPMSRMKFRLQVLEEEALSKAGEKATQGMRRDIDEVNELIQEALEFDRGSLEHQLKPVGLARLIGEIIQDLKDEFPQIQFDDSAVVTEAMSLQDSQQVKRLVKNIMQNACKYGGGRVMVQLLEQKKHWLIKIEDDGPGIPDEMKLSIFSPFTRLETSRNKQTGGMGLGLAIADNIARLAGIDISVKDSPLGGACFSLKVAKIKDQEMTQSSQELG
jgi:signal transduction histidine kinase